MMVLLSDDGGCIVEVNPRDSAPGAYTAFHYKFYTNGTTSVINDTKNVEDGRSCQWCRKGGVHFLEEG
jgi:hypothetical protein